MTSTGCFLCCFQCKNGLSCAARGECALGGGTAPPRLGNTGHSSIPSGGWASGFATCGICSDPQYCFRRRVCSARAQANDQHIMPLPARDTTAKPTNPKDMIGSDKIPLHLWPETATAMGAMALLDGALKYGRANWRVAGVRASIYVDAARRHLSAWFEGEDKDPDSGLPHLAHALACLAILVDSQAAGKLTDDRQVRGGFRDILTLLTPEVIEAKRRHEGKAPKHYTIADNGETA